MAAAAADRSFFHAPGSALGIVAVGLALGLLGVAQASDFRGWTGRHVRSTMRIMVPLSRRIRLARGTENERFARQYRLERIIGFVFAAVGCLLVVVGIIGLIGWAVVS